MDRRRCGTPAAARHQPARATVTLGSIRRAWLAGALAALSVSAAGWAQGDPPEAPETALLVELARAIESLSDYRVAGVALPRVRELPQRELEARFCDGLCSALAAYLPGDGIYLSAHLDPVREPEDRAALLHELVHHFQQGHPKFAGLRPCQREREKEREAVAIQNAYLAQSGVRQRVRFHDAFDCAE